MVTSLNYPCKYPGNLKQTETIIAKEGMVVDLEFTAFKTWWYDELKIQDNDGTILLPARTGHDLPPPVRSRTNVVHLQFVTRWINYCARRICNFGYITRRGWSATWTSAKLTGENLQKQLFSLPIWKHVSLLWTVKAMMINPVIKIWLSSSLLFVCVFSFLVDKWICFY